MRSKNKAETNTGEGPIVEKGDILRFEEADSAVVYFLVAGILNLGDTGIVKVILHEQLISGVHSRSEFRGEGISGNRAKLVPLSDGEVKKIERQPYIGKSVLKEVDITVVPRTEVPEDIEFSYSR